MPNIDFWEFYLLGLSLWFAIIYFIDRSWFWAGLICFCFCIQSLLALFSHDLSDALLYVAIALLWLPRVND